MLIFDGIVDSTIKLTDKYHLIKIYAPQIASKVTPGQFCNIKVSETTVPLLRRPFSVSDVDGDYIFFMFDVCGSGTRILSMKEKGDTLDILGPLGNGFNIEGDYNNAIIVSGGIGVAPFPLLTRKLEGKNITTYLGGRSSEHLITYGLKNVNLASDDGSEGYHGNVLELLMKNGSNIISDDTRIFVCGPSPMLRALQKFSNDNNYDCQLSTESAMACGFGICQGCPIEDKDGNYKLCCKDGPVFNSGEIVL